MPEPDADELHYLREPSKAVEHMDADELAQYLTIRVYEANLIMRCLGLMGVKVAVDVVDREHAGYPEGYRPEIVARMVRRES